MTAATDPPVVQGFLALVRAGVDGLLSTDLTGLAAAQVTGLLVGVEAELRRAAAVDHRLIHEVSERSLAGELGASSVPALLVQLLRVAPGEARARVRAAEELGPRRAVTGEALEPVLPVVAAAVRGGEISSGHVSVISKALDALPVTLAPEVHEVAEEFLVEAARHEHPAALGRTAEQLLLRLDPDGRQPREDELERRRGFDLVKRADGSSKPTGSWTPEATAVWETILDSLAQPVPGADGMPDTRSASQRRHDAMLDAAHRLLNSGTLPPVGGTPVTVLVKTSAGELESGKGVATTGHGDVISVRQLLQLASEAAIVSLLCSENGEVLNLGREQRLATKKQRLALFARDGGCCFPGCDRPAAWAEAHHIVEWQTGGNTDIDNLCLLCRYHHRHFEEFGWTVHTAADDGKPEWLPPPWVDPERRPVRNTAHHIRDFDFRRAHTLAPA